MSEGTFTALHAANKITPTLTIQPMSVTFEAILTSEKLPSLWKVEGIGGKNGEVKTSGQGESALCQWKVKLMLINSGNQWISFAALTLIGLPLISISAFSRDGVGGISVDAAFYRPDRGTPFAWFEMAKGIEHFHRENYRAAGLVEVYLRNNGKEPVSVERIFVNGKDVTEPEKGGDVVWWRLRPNPIPAEGFGELLIRLREAPKEPTALEVQTSTKETLRLKIQPALTPIRMEGLAFDEKGERIFAFVELVGEGKQRITRVLLDGEDVTKRTFILSPNFWFNVCPIVVRSPKRLAFGSFHYLRVDTDKGAKAAVLFRARDDFSLWALTAMSRRKSMLPTTATFMFASAR
jgi:hypothetical protein